jgi:hypothetical protein
VLDPTCGSGAFLFAALNILKPLYEACLIQMQNFVKDMEAAGPHHPKKLHIFKDVLAESADHPKQDYFILKSIIVNNLFGVDIMDEAVEICKLRLFLKLVAQVESQDKIEPLPDIDFNIRAGNTLVGYAKLSDIQPERGIRTDEENEMLAKIEDKALILDAKVRTFRIQQTQLDGTVTAEDKTELRRLFSELEAELNDYLSGEYGIKKSGVKKWKESHKPFHWFCDFHRIVASGGFDVIIGNPPWKEYAEVKKDYQLYGYSTESCGNLHGITTERAISLVREHGRVSFIVQLPLTSSSRMKSVRHVLRRDSAFVSAISFDDRPGKLFEGLQNCRSTIFNYSKRNGANSTLFTSRYIRWATDARSNIFPSLEFTSGGRDNLFSDQFAKIGSDAGRAVLGKLDLPTLKSLGTTIARKPTEDFIFYQEATRYWVKATVVLPYYAKNGKVGAPAHGRYVYFPDTKTANICSAILNSSLFYLYFVAFGDCFHLSDSLVANFPIPSAALKDPRLFELNKELMADLKRNSVTKTITTKDKKTKLVKDIISYAEFDARSSKPIIDSIDCILAEHYEFTSTELDLILNFDIKFRLGSDQELDVEEE